jgi:hypothetical protein
MRNYVHQYVSLLVFLFIAAFLATNSFGQAVSGNIIGTVTDPSGAGVAGAQITITNVGTGVASQTTTNDSGNYTAASLPPGSYSITITKPGFQKFTQQNVRVDVSQSIRVDASLQVGAATQEVTVSAAPPAIETDRAVVQTQLSGAQISSLPISIEISPT